MLLTRLSAHPSVTHCSLTATLPGIYLSVSRAEPGSIDIDISLTKCLLNLDMIPKICTAVTRTHQQRKTSKNLLCNFRCCMSVFIGRHRKKRKYFQRIKINRYERPIDDWCLVMGWEAVSTLLTTQVLNMYQVLFRTGFGLLHSHVS